MAPIGDDKLKAAMLVLGELYFNFRMSEDDLERERQRNEILEREVNSLRAKTSVQEGAGNEK